MTPVEYKIGTAHGTAPNVQLCAQALCIEEMTGLPVPVGFIWYGGTRRRIRVTTEEVLRKATRDAIDEVRHVMRADRLPIPVNDHRCRSFQFIGHCQPELSSGPSRVEDYIREELHCNI